MRSIVNKVIHHCRKWPSDNYNDWNTMVGMLTPDEKDYVLDLFKFKVKILDVTLRIPAKKIKRY